MRLVNADPIEREIIREVSKLWLAELLKGKERKIKISIVMAEKIDDCKGYTLDTSNYSKTGNTTFSISIDKRFHLSFKLRILAHELAHIRQYVHGELKDSHDAKQVYWKGKTYENDDNFLKQPWEQEALRMEARLYRKLIKYCDERKINIIPQSAKKNINN